MKDIVMKPKKSKTRKTIISETKIEIVQLTPHPPDFKFVPSKDVMHKIILRAMAVKNVAELYKL
jgi:hypothetical protein